jgi:transposase, IS30 family
VRKLKHHIKLTLTERKRIAAWITDEKSLREIARLLGRSHSTIIREVARNLFKKSRYEPLHAQGKAEKRKLNAFKAKHPLKNKEIFKYTIDHLRQGWSPEEIAGRLKQIEHPDDPSRHICKETIYEYIYSGKWPYQDKEPLYEYLRRKQKKRRKRGGRKVQRVRIPDRVSIHERPKEVEKRKVAGHWEGDSIVGKGHKNGCHTQYERVTSMIRIERMERLTSEESIKAQMKIFSSLPPHLRRSTTLDNGMEHVEHKKLEVLGVKTYFADANCAYQRGGNENANLWIRYYFPKGTDFSKITNEEIKDVEWELNNRPRKRLGYLTPQEVFNNLLVQS